MLLHHLSNVMAACWKNILWFVQMMLLSGLIWEKAHHTQVSLQSINQAKVNGPLAWWTWDMTSTIKPFSLCPARTLRNRSLRTACIRVLQKLWTEYFEIDTGDAERKLKLCCPSMLLCASYKLIELLSCIFSVPLYITGHEQPCNYIVKSGQLLMVLKQ